MEKKPYFLQWRLASNGMKEAGRDGELPVVRRPIASEKACPGFAYYQKEIET